MLTWLEPNFSSYAFDIVALLNGTFEAGRISSFHAFGTTEWAEAEKKKHENQKKKGSPKRLPSRLTNHKRWWKMGRLMRIC
jgi:inorganic triphosphatase YgiF